MTMSGRKKEDNQYHDILLAVQTGNKLSDNDRLTLKNDDFSMSSSEEMVKKSSLSKNSLREVSIGSAFDVIP